jgi:hypothetical protein
MRDGFVAARRAFSVRHVVGGFGQRHIAQLAPDHAGVEAGAEQRAIQRSCFTLIKGAARQAGAPLDHFAHKSSLVHIGEDLRKGRIDVPVGNAAPAQFLGNASPPLAAHAGAGTGKIERVSRIIDQLFFFQTSHHAAHSVGLERAALKIRTQLKSGMRAAHQRAQRRGVKFAFARFFLRLRTHTAPSIEAFAEISNAKRISRPEAVLGGGRYGNRTVILSKTKDLSDNFFALSSNPQNDGKMPLAAAELLVFGHGALHLLACRVGGGADALHAQLEVVGVGCAAERFLKADEVARIEIVE